MPACRFRRTTLLETETPNPQHPDLDQYDAQTMARVFISDQINAVNAVLAAHEDIAHAVQAALPRIARGGRLIYMGAGTSGRLGVLDSVELSPTFSWPASRAIGLMAGGPGAMFGAVEHAEDDRKAGAADIAACALGPDDVVLMISASGSTPYVLAAIEHARAAGALTIGVANNRDAPVSANAEIGITLDSGAEIISGSTRLKAGTAQKIALNTFSSMLMVMLHKVYGNLMVDVRPTNAKLIRRTATLTRIATGADDETVQRALQACDFHVKTAIVMIRKSVPAAEARAALEASGGSVRAALSCPGPQ
jgi:N-acetylmuramic acid 6-phosphate etherase